MDLIVVRPPHSDANGNQLADLGGYTKLDGSTGTVGEVGGSLADINLTQDTFHSQFTDHITLTTQAKTLPEMGGSGLVRSLREAMSLSVPLAGLVASFAAATTREAQTALIDQIISAWANTSSMKTTLTGAYTGHALTLSMQNIDPSTTAGAAQYGAVANMLTILERFNGRTL